MNGGTNGGVTASSGANSPHWNGAQSHLAGRAEGLAGYGLVKAAAAEHVAARKRQRAGHHAAAHAAGELVRNVRQWHIAAGPWRSLCLDNAGATVYLGGFLQATQQCTLKPMCSLHCIGTSVTCERNQQ